MKLIEDLGMQYPKPTSACKSHYGIFECPLCGREFKTNVKSVKCGQTKSCGCVARVEAGKRIKANPSRYKHGWTGTVQYIIWKSMRSRCLNPKHKDYDRYGGRGIKICNEWLNSADSFCRWAITNGYKEGLILDRENVNGNYEPSNCRFVTPPISGQNQRLYYSTNTSGYRGVSWHKMDRAWVANISWNGKAYHLGCFPTKELAAQAYNDFVVQHNTAHPLNIIQNQKPNQN